MKKALHILVGLILMFSFIAWILYYINIIIPESISKALDGRDNGNARVALGKILQLTISPPSETFPYDYSALCKNDELKLHLARAGTFTKSNAVCVSTTESWAIELELIGGEYYCIDSNNIAIVTSRSSNLNRTVPICDGE